MDRAQAFLSQHGLSVHKTEVKGRCVVAQKKFSEGDTIHPWQEPYAASVRNNNLSSACSACFTACSKLSVCSRCKYTRYCSKECQKFDWISGHKLLCPNIQRILPNKPTESLMLMAKILLRAGFEKENASCSNESFSFEDIQCLQSHKNKALEADLLMYAKMGAMSAHLVGQEIFSILDLSPSVMVDLFCKFKSNNYNICDPQMNAIGIGIYPGVKQLLACNPNCVPIFDGKKVKIISVRPIEPQEEITISYIEIASPTAFRRRELEDHFFFTCSCNRCLDTTEDAELCSLCPGVTNQEAQRRTEAIEALLQHPTSEGDPFSQYTKCLSLVSSSFPLTTYSSLKYHDALSKIFLDLQEWQNARKCILACLPTCEKIYAKFWPMLGLQYFTLGKLDWFLQNDKSADEYLTKAHDILRRLYDERSPLMLELNETLREVKAYRR